jgi:hypothetical protein
MVNQWGILSEVFAKDAFLAQENFVEVYGSTREGYGTAEKMVSSVSNARRRRAGDT